MPQANVSKSRIIDVVWSPASRSNGHRGGTIPMLPVPTAAMPLPSPFIAQEPRPDEPEPPREVVTTLALSSPVMVIEDVQPLAPLDPRLILLAAPASPQAGAFRLLQHRCFSKHDPRVIAVTSATAGEGKTTCAVNLALALSEGTYARVLLIDANLRRPAIADVFRFEPADSLMTKLLRNEDATPPYAVASISFSRLQLAALRPDVAASKRLDRELLTGLLRALRQAYDYIVIDTSAVLESADANVAAQCADGTVVTVRSGSSRERQVRRAIDHLQPANVVGAVLLDS